MTYRTTPLLSVTSGDLHTWGACYSDDQITRHFAGAESLTPRQITEQDITHDDKVWVLVRCLRTADCVVFAHRCEDVTDARYVTVARSARSAAAYRADAAAADAAAAACYADAHEQQIVWLLELLGA